MNIYFTTELIITNRQGSLELFKTRILVLAHWTLHRGFTIAYTSYKHSYWTVLDTSWTSKFLLRTMVLGALETRILALAHSRHDIRVLQSVRKVSATSKTSNWKGRFLTRPAGRGRQILVAFQSPTHIAEASAYKYSHQIIKYSGQCAW